MLSHRFWVALGDDAACGERISSQNPETAIETSIDPHYSLQMRHAVPQRLRIEAWHYHRTLGKLEAAIITIP